MKLETRFKKTISTYNEAVNELKVLQSEMLKTVSKSGLVQKKFIEKLGITTNTFYKKKRNLSFTIEEIKKIMKILTSKII